MSVYLGIYTSHFMPKVSNLPKVLISSYCAFRCFILIFQKLLEHGFTYFDSILFIFSVTSIIICIVRLYLKNMNNYTKLEFISILLDNIYNILYETYMYVNKYISKDEIIDFIDEITRINIE